MYVVTAQEMSEIESQAFQEGESAEQYMENAGKGIAKAVEHFTHNSKLNTATISLLCGKGNNAGDAYVAGRLLQALGYTVTAYQALPLDQCGPLCQIKAQLFTEAGGRILSCSEEEWELPEEGVILDGLFGTGFAGDVQGIFKSLIEKANASAAPILAIDIPSGLNGSTGEVSSTRIQALKTLYLGLPKLGFFLQQGWNCVGKLEAIDFGLPQRFISQATPQYQTTNKAELAQHLPKLHASRHKYQAGYVVGLAGSVGLSGAAILSSSAALRAGSGIVRLIHPHSIAYELQGLPAEIVTQSIEKATKAQRSSVASGPYQLMQQELAKTRGGDHSLLGTLNSATACYLGPGLGQEPATQQLLKEVLPQIQVPCVIDADALNLYAKIRCPLPRQCVMTPHYGEMRRLLGMTGSEPLDCQFLKRCQAFAEENRVFLILKGGPTFIFAPGETTAISIFGDPGMASAGTGDVLTGIIASLLSQGVEMLQACHLGTALHGLAGEHASKELTPYCMAASDLIEFLKEAYRDLASHSSHAAWLWY